MDYLFSGGRGQRNLARDNPGNYCQRKVADSPDIADSVTRTANRFQYTHATIAGHKCRRFISSHHRTDAGSVRRGAEVVIDICRLLQLIDGNPFVLRMSLCDIAGSEDDRRNSDRCDS